MTIAVALGAMLLLARAVGLRLRFTKQVLVLIVLALLLGQFGGKGANAIAGPLCLLVIVGLGFWTMLGRPEVRHRDYCDRCGERRKSGKFCPECGSTLT